MSTIVSSEPIVVSAELRDAVGVSEWDVLADRVDAPPFLRAGWIDAWWRAFGRGRLELLTARRAGRLTGVLPFSRWGGGVYSPTNWHTPAYGPLSEDLDVTRALGAELFGAPSRRVDLSFLEAGADETAGLLGAAEAHRTVLRRTVSRSPFVAVEGDWDSYERGLSKNRRRSIRRRRCQLEELGQVRVDIHEGGPGLEGALEEALHVEASGWKGQQATAIASRPETRRFYLDIAHWAAERGWMRLAFLRLDGRPLAFDYAIEHSGRCYSLKAGYDAAFRSYGPGVLLLHLTLARAFSEGLSSYELLGADDPYKHDWTNASRERLRIQAFARSPGGTVDWLAQAHGRPLARRMLGRAPR